MAFRRQGEAEQLYRATSGFAVATRGGGFPTVYGAGALVRADDPILKSHGELFEPASAGVEAAAPAGEQGRGLPGNTLAEVTKHRTGHAHRDLRTGDKTVPHRNALPPEHPDSPASPFAPVQPGAGVVADDVPDAQNLAGGPKASEVTAEELGVEEYVQTASDPTRGAGPVPAGKTDPSGGGDAELQEGHPRGQALEDALDEAGLSKSGTADEKRARLAEHQQQQQGQSSQ